SSAGRPRARRRALATDEPGRTASGLWDRRPRADRGSRRSPGRLTPKALRAVRNESAGEGMPLFACETGIHPFAHTEHVAGMGIGAAMYSEVRRVTHQNCAWHTAIIRRVAAGGRAAC